MRKYTAPLLAIFLATLSAGAACADAKSGNAVPRDPEQARELIEHLYKLEQAFAVCDDVRVTGSDLMRLEDAIADVEQSAGIAASDLEAIYDQVETLAAGNPASFCSEIGDASAGIKTIAVEQRD